MKLLHVSTKLAIAATVALSNADAAAVALYDFEAGGSGNTFAGQAGLNSADSEPNSTATILTSIGLDGGGANNIFNTAQGGSASGPPLSNWGNGHLPEGSANFAQFTTSPAGGYQITYESLSLFHGSFNATGQVKITYAIGAGPDTVALGPASHTAANSDPLTFLSEDFADFTTSDTVTWKIHVFGTDAENTGTRLDDITINGSVTLIPEPSAALLSLLCAGLFAARRRR